MKFFRDIIVNLIGVLIAALISISFAFYFYNHQGKEQCISIIEMVIKENALNEVRCENLLKRLNGFVRDGSSVEGPIFAIRLLCRSTSFASESEIVARYVPSELRSRIYVHSENTCNFNANLNNFNNYLMNHVDDGEVNLRLLKEWATILIDGTKARCTDSSKLANELSEYIALR